MSVRDSSEELGLVRLTSEQITRYWEDIKHTVSYSLPPTEQPSETGYNNLLDSLLNESAQAWIPTDERGVRGILVTLITQEAVLGTKNLLVMSAFSYDSMTDKLWGVTYDVLKRFARSQGCRFIVGYTMAPRIVEVVNYLGGDTRWTFVRLEVN